MVANELLSEMVQGIARAGELTDALEHVLSRLCLATEWEYAEAWLPDPCGESLKLAAACTSGRPDLEAFADASLDYLFPRGVGLPGRVWKSGKAEMIHDLSLLSLVEFPRHTLAREVGMRAALGVPIVWKEEVLGVLVFFAGDPMEEDPEVLRLVMATAISMGSFLHIRRTEEELRIEHEHSMLDSSAFCAAEYQDSAAHHVVRFLYTSLRGLMPYERVGIATFSEQGHLHLRAYCADRADRHVPFPYVVKLRDSSLTTLAATRQPRIISDFRDFMTSKPNSQATQLLVREGYLSSLTIPLIHADVVFGFLFFTCREAESYREVHVHLVQRVVGDIAGLLVNDLEGSSSDCGRLKDRFTGIVRNARKAFEEENMLATVVSSLSREYTPGAVLNQVYDSCHEILPYNRIGYARLIENSSKVRATWARTDGKVRLGLGFTQRLEETSLPDILTIGTPRILNDLSKYLVNHPKSVSTRLVVEEGMSSSLTVPLMTNSGPMGFLFFSSREREAYKPEHAARIQRIAAPLAQILEKAALFGEIKAAKEHGDQLLDMLMPKKVAKRLRGGETKIADRMEVSVVFADMVDFTEWSNLLEPVDLVNSLGRIFKAFDELARMYGVQKIRTIGDGYLAVAGLPTPHEDHAWSAASLAIALRDYAGTVQRPDGKPLSLRLGISTGTVVAGVLGHSDLHYDVWGDTVNLASRLESSSEVGRIQVSSKAAEVLAPQFNLVPRGVVALKGFGEMKTWWLESSRYS